MKKRVLVTRPEPGASETAARLEALGFDAVVLPLTRIAPLEPDPLPDRNAFDAIAVTSVNALRHASPEMLEPLSGMPAFAVGDATAEAARQAGFATVFSASGTAVDLTALIAAQMPAGSCILHLAGRDRTAGFAEALQEHGFHLQIVEVYTAEKVSYPTDFLMATFAAGPVWAAPVLSTRAALLLGDLIAHAGLKHIFENTRFFCISEKVAAALGDAANGRANVSTEPTEESVMALLSSQR